jgi:pimeloyl-ACP methyl ester carboxylesterase
MKTMVTGAGFPLVLMPGGLTGWETFEPHAARWSQERQVIRAQLLNVDYGLRGEALPTDYSTASEARALLSALDVLKVERFDLLGWSHGGGAAINVALANPGRVRTLTLAEPDAFWLLHVKGLFGPDAEELRDAMADYTRAEVGEDDLAAFLHAVGVVPADVDPRTLDRWPVWVKYRNSLSLGDIPFHHSEDIDRLRAFDRPVLLIKGTGSPPHMVDMVDALATEFPQARVVELAGGHAMVVVSLDAFIDIVSRFLREADRADGR